MDPVSHAAAALKEWSRKGLVITPVCDGSTRPQSKQQSNLNRAMREKSRCDAILARQQLRLLSQKADPSEQDSLQQRALERKIKTADRGFTALGGVFKTFSDFGSDGLI